MQVGYAIIIVLALLALLLVLMSPSGSRKMPFDPAIMHPAAL